MDKLEQIKAVLENYCSLYEKKYLEELNANYSLHPDVEQAEAVYITATTIAKRINKIIDGEDNATN